MIAAQLKLEASNKEGWISGLADVVLEHQKENGIELFVAFPMEKDFPAEKEGGPTRGQWNETVFKVEIRAKGAAFTGYGFPEDVSHPERGDSAVLTEALEGILQDAKPDLVHCFGSEYLHTAVMCRIFPRKERLLIGLQGLCSMLAKAYFANLPKNVIHSVTLRDFLKQDSLIQQQEKFVMRGRIEREAIEQTGNLAGRTQWDRACTEKWNPKAKYHHLDEILRSEFYGPQWEEEHCIPHSIFLSQGDYPLKGLHYMLHAMPSILATYPDTRVYVAGNSLVRCGTVKERLKLSAYGKYLRGLIKQYHLEDKIFFFGRLNAGQMRDRYLSSHLFVCTSSLENSPNSLGEAMMLGMPCIAANVGGIPSLFLGDVDGLIYEGFQTGDGEELDRISCELSNTVIRMWKDPVKMREYCRNARLHAEHTHDREKNYEQLMDIYQTMYDADDS